MAYMLIYNPSRRHQNLINQFQKVANLVCLLLGFNIEFVSYYLG